MNDTWDYELIDLLDAARGGKKKDLQAFLDSFSPQVTVNEACSLLVVLRKFHVHLWKHERSVLNCRPESDAFQWGITVVTSSDGSGSESNVYLPNHLQYKGLQLAGEVITLLVDGVPSTVTNPSELFRKLRNFGDFSEQDLVAGYQGLHNEIQAPKKRSPRKESRAKIQIPSCGDLVWDEDEESYSGKFKDGKRKIAVSLPGASPKKLEKLVALVETRIQSRFFEQVLSDAEPKLIALKNDSWLEDDESPLEPLSFRRQLKIRSIAFSEDGSCTIECGIGDLFWGHDIEIDVDKKGKYLDSSLVG